MELWQTILLTFGGNAALLAVLGIITKSLLDKVIARDTAEFEAALNAKSESTIEKLKNELQLKTIEHQVRFSRLHEKRASVIADLYSHLVEALWETESFFSPVQWSGEPGKQEKHKTAMNKLVELYCFFDKHRIYLPAELCNSLEDLFMLVRQHVIHFGVYLDFDEQSINDDTRIERSKVWNEGWDAIKNKVPVARQKLEDEFRILLGAAANKSLNPSSVETV